MAEFDNFLDTQAAYKHMILSVIDLCKTERRGEDLIDFISNYPASETLTFTPTEILGIIIDFKTLDVRFDEDTSTEYMITNPYGLSILDKYDTTKSLRELINNSGDMGQIYKELLQICSAGKTTAEIESLMGDNKILKKENVFINYCVRELEKAGGIYWQGSAWLTTEVGNTI